MLTDLIVLFMAVGGQMSTLHAFGLLLLRLTVMRQNEKDRSTKCVPPVLACFCICVSISHPAAYQSSPPCSSA